MALHKFKIEYRNDNEEVVAAQRNEVDGEWIVFVDGIGTQLLRVRANDVHSIRRDNGS